MSALALGDALSRSRVACAGGARPRCLAPPSATSPLQPGHTRGQPGCPPRTATGLALPSSGTCPGIAGSSSSSGRGGAGLRPGGHVACRATLDDPKIATLVVQMVKSRPPPGQRLQLARVLETIDSLNAKDPQQVDYEGKKHPYRLLYSQWVSDWVQKLDPGAPDELYILARGQSVEGWRLAEIKRDDFSPNTGGQRQWEQERKAWLANRLTGIMKEAGYPEGSCSLVGDYMMGRNLPDPRDVRMFDLQLPMGQTNYRLLEILKMQQTLRDADCLVFLTRSFPRMFDAMAADEVLPEVKRQFAMVSRQCLATALQMPWDKVQRKLLMKALPTPAGWGDTLRQLEGVGAASTHPGDWRYANFDYE